MKAEVFLDWEEEELEPETAEEVWLRLIRGVRRNEGAGWFFVQCSPVQEQEAIERLQQSFGKGKVAILELNRESTNLNLYSEAKARYEREDFTVLVVQGIEQVLFAYEDAKRSLGWDEAQVRNYSSKDVPPILNHLNQVRESLWETVPCALVFMMRRFALRYFMFRAPDFYDWRAGLFVIPNLADEEETTIERGRYHKYCQLSTVERLERIDRLREIIGRSELAATEKAELLVEQGRLFASGEDYLIALSSYDKAIQLQPNYSRAWKNRGINLCILERYEEAIFNFDKAIELQPGYSRAWRNRGIALDKLGRYEEAISTYQHAIELQPYSSTTWNEYGNTLSETGRYEKAISSYNKAIEVKPDDSRAWFNHGLALGRLGRYEEAISSYDQAIKLKPDYSRAWFNHGLALGRRGKYEEAISSYDQAIKLKPDYSRAWNNRGWALINLGRNEEALPSVDKALELKPDNSHAWHSRGMALYNIGRYEEALSSYDRAIELQPSRSDAWSDDRQKALAKLK
ncbi:MAG: tetratricopeptide repeat protein [Roseofilum sp. SID1]|uniref:tetratricopeptide repeat protein n=1 Tax=Roseofilum sp. SID1 TaxID=2821497 RepID=UPI001B23481C|nr:tetratricopeptide repeat protein [Roseofilum sp. SID1]MBP0038062.1 tetratricopeptide repeat protein [Roseofilum sp. SID1]